jgi:hypothetical protein
MCTLLAFVGDGTSRLMQLRFGASESAFDYLRATRTYLEAHGKPVAFYSDKHGIFRVNVKDAVGGIALHSLAVCDRMIAQGYVLLTDEDFALASAASFAA